MTQPAQAIATVLRCSQRRLVGAAQEEAVARLEYLADAQQKLGWLRGTSGVGKTFVLEHAARHWRRLGRCVALLNVRRQPPQVVLWQLACQWQCPVLAGASYAVLWQAIAEAAAVCRVENRQAIVLVDDADDAPEETVALLERLLELADVTAAPLTFVFATGQHSPQRYTPRWRQRVELRIDLHPWDLAETLQYIEEQLPDDREPLTFEPLAIDRLHQQTGGLPRAVSQLVRLALLAARSTSQPQIDAGMVDQVAWELAACPVS